MNCLFCKQELLDFKEDWDVEWDCLDNRIYTCQTCHATFTQKVVYDRQFTNQQKSDWRWVDSGKEELTYYRMTLEDYEIECFAWSNGPFIVRRWDANHKLIWQVLKLSTAPTNINPQTLVSRIKTWVLFS